MATPTLVRSDQHTSLIPNGLREAIQRHPLFSFFFIAYTFTWLTFIPNILSAWGLLAGNWTVTYVVHCFGPAVAAIIVLGATEGKIGLSRLWRRIIQWRVGWQWYLLILVGIPAVFLVGLIAQPGGLATFKGFTPSAVISYPIALIAIALTTGGIGEEIGWRGFALPRMQPRYGPLRATLLLGVLWTFWHLADFLTPGQGGGPGTGFTTFLTDIFIFFVVVMALNVIFTWLFNHTGGSVLMATLAHASVDNPQVVWVPLVFAVSVSTVTIAGLVAFVVPALLIIVLTHGRLGYQPR